MIHSDNSAYAGAVVRLSPVPDDSGTVTTDADGKALRPDPGFTMESRTLLEVNGCPAATLERNSAYPMGTWKILVDDSLERLCHRTVRFRVEGHPGFPVAWRAPSVLEFGDSHHSRWVRTLGDSTVLDASGRGSLGFNGLVQPFLEAPALTLVANGLSFSRGWQVRASDSTLVLLWPPAGDTLRVWPGCLRGDHDSLCWNHITQWLQHWHRTGPTSPWDTAECSFGIRYTAVLTDGSLSTFPSIDGHLPAGCGQDSVHWALRRVVGNDSVVWLDTLPGQGMLLRPVR